MGRLPGEVKTGVENPYNPLNYNPAGLGTWLDLLSLPSSPALSGQG